MRTTSQKPEASHLTANEIALQTCRTALELRDRGDYDAAQNAMRGLWRGVGERPETTDLHPLVAAEVLFCAGILTGWIGSKNEIKEADDHARDLINESIRLYESAGDFKKVAEARTELAYCYWRAGALDEARIMFAEALERLTIAGNTRANALLGSSVVEWSSARYDDALQILTENAPLFRKIANHTLKGFYYNQLAIMLRHLATEEKETEYFQRAIKAYEEADREFKLARNTVFRAHVKNNLGFLLFKLSHYRKAHAYLNHARRLTVSVRDRVRTAQVDETRAQVFIAERRYAQAEVAARSAVRSFEKAGRECFLAEALITLGIALARRGKMVAAQFALQRAIEVGHQAGALNRAGIAALTMIEEVDNLSPEILCRAYERAGEWLATSQSQEIFLRFIAAGKKLASTVLAEPKSDGATESEPRTFKQELLEVEREMIRTALAKVNGSVTHAASLLGMSYQRLAYLIRSRHRDLLKERSPVHNRSRKKE